MAIVVTDRKTMTPAFKEAITVDQTEPLETAQFEHGRGKATLEIDYSFTEIEDDPEADPQPESVASLQLVFLNANENVFCDGVKTPLEVGKHTIKLDVFGRAGGFYVTDMVNAQIDWLYFRLIPRETGGN